jgi:hypothetical protein
VPVKIWLPCSEKIAAHVVCFPSLDARELSTSGSEGRTRLTGLGFVISTRKGVSSKSAQINRLLGLSDHVYKTNQVKESYWL